MSGDGIQNSGVVKSDNSLLVTRSSVPAGLNYGDYRRYLRHDFFYSCAYCTMTEAEAHGIRFCIDHYEPKSARPDLENTYENLMYSCDPCNTLKGDRCPPPAARADGHRFFKPDQDRYNSHFELSELLLKPKTSVGNFTIEALDLNRHALRTIRRLRARLSECELHVAAGVLELRHFQIDQLPPKIRGQAFKLIREFDRIADEIRDEIDTILREFARSALLDEDIETKGRAEERAAEMSKLETIYPGVWRASRKKKRGK